MPGRAQVTRRKFWRCVDSLPDRLDVWTKIFVIGIPQEIVKFEGTGFKDGYFWKLYNWEKCAQKLEGNLEIDCPPIFQARYEGRKKPPLGQVLRGGSQISDREGWPREPHIDERNLGRIWGHEYRYLTTVSVDQWPLCASTNISDPIWSDPSNRSGRQDVSVADRDASRLRCISRRFRKLSQ